MYDMIFWCITVRANGHASTEITPVFVWSKFLNFKFRAVTLEVDTSNSVQLIGGKEKNNKSRRSPRTGVRDAFMVERCECAYETHRAERKTHNSTNWSIRLTQSETWHQENRINIYAYLNESVFLWFTLCV